MAREFERLWGVSYRLTFLAKSFVKSFYKRMRIFFERKGLHYPMDWDPYNVFFNYNPDQFSFGDKIVLMKRIAG